SCDRPGACCRAKSSCGRCCGASSRRSIAASTPTSATCARSSARCPTAWTASRASAASAISSRCATARPRTGPSERRLNRVYLKICVWFWVGVAVVSATLLTLTELTHSRADDDRRWQEKYGPRVHMWARQQTGILGSEGAPALARYIASIEYDPGVSNYVFD